MAREKAMAEEGYERERAALLAQAKALLPVAREALRALGGPSLLANDDNPISLALAYANREWVDAFWCSEMDGHGQLFYWACPETGRHGWACLYCRGLVQVG